MIDLEHVLVVGALLFSIGLYIALSRRSAVGVLSPLVTGGLIGGLLGDPKSNPFDANPLDMFAA